MIWRVFDNHVNLAVFASLPYTENVSLQRSENPSKGANAAEVWNGSMAGALALLGGGGGGTSVNTSSNNCNWMACLSRGERILEPACVRLKEAVEKVLTRLK